MRARHLTAGLVVGCRRACSFLRAPIQALFRPKYDPPRGASCHGCRRAVFSAFLVALCALTFPPGCATRPVGDDVRSPAVSPAPSLLTSSPTTRLLVVRPPGLRAKEDVLSARPLLNLPGVSIADVPAHEVALAQAAAERAGFIVEHDFQVELCAPELPPLPPGLLTSAPTADPLTAHDPNRRLPWISDASFLRDEYFWHLDNTGESSRVYSATNGAVIPAYDEPPAVPGASTHAAEAWLIQPSSTVTVGVIDTGMDTTHEDLQDVLWWNEAERAGQPGVDDDSNGFVDDLHGIYMPNYVPPPTYLTTNLCDQRGHGTGVSSVLAATRHNGLGGAGVAKCPILVLRSELYVSQILISIDYAIAQGIRILNCSWVTEENSAVLKAAFVKAGEAGVLIATGVPNEPRDLEARPIYPASWRLPHVIVTGSTTRADEYYKWVAHGSNTVHLGAPGRNIVIALAGCYASPSRTPITNTPPRYGYSSGSSYAAPCVAAAASLVMARFPGESYLRTKYRILSSVDVIPSHAGKTITSGRLNIARALRTELPRPRLSLQAAAQTVTVSIETFNKRWPVDYTVERSADLVSWSSWKTFTATNEVTHLTDARSARSMFYRVL